ncbi:MAG: hypothetical protein JSS07_04830 [Proteobacteria bacterium]|nr:hypothetical protein [Pseudomonadota bacterium]
MSKRHLSKLPLKSSAVAPGDIVGGLIYVMDKPVGVEPGMIGISRDSAAYLDFVKMQLDMLEKASHPNTQLQARFSTILKQHPDYNTLDLPKKIDILLEDKVHIKRNRPMSKTDLKKIFFDLGKYHEVKAGEYYENVGCGGLLFHEYKKALNINKKDHFAEHIQKLIDKKNEVYMVKQDGKMVLGRTGPNSKRLMKTEIGRKLQILAHPFISLATLGVSALGFGVGILGWRALIMSQSKPIDANAAAIAEEVATKVANIRGFNSQEIEIIEGTYEDNTPKLATIVTWSPGCRDLTGKLAGAESNKNNVIVSCNKEGPIKVDAQGNIIRIKRAHKAAEKTYEKILKDGSIQIVNKQDYMNAMAVSEDTIAGLGESLISFISMGDRDGIGELGQNKVILPLKPPQGKYQYQFFGIDFGKAYENENPIIHTLADDFSIINPSNRKQRFLNISILYDTPLREKMKGVYLLAALRNKFTDEQKENIAKDYESNGDKLFADKLRAYPESLFDKYGEDIGLELENTEGEKLLQAQKVKRWIKNGDLWWIKNEENKYLEMASKADKKLKTHYLHYADKLANIYTLAQTADKKVLDVFAKRFQLMPKQIEILDNLEKLTAEHVHVKSPDGKVWLNHLRVEREDRIAWQCEEKEGKFNLICSASTNLAQIRQKLSLIKNNPLADKIKIINNQLSIAGLSQQDMNILSELITEEKVASMRKDAAGFRTNAMQAEFHQRLMLNEQQQKQSEPKAKMQATQPESLDDLTPKTALSQKELRKKPVAYYAQSNKESNTREIITQNQIDTKKLASFYEQHQAQFPSLHINRKSKGKLIIDIDVPNINSPFQAFVEEDDANQKLNYSAKNDLFVKEKEDDFASVCQELCSFAVNAAEPFTQFDISVAPPDKRSILQQTFEKAIAKAVLEKRFDEASKPSIIGSEKPKSVSIIAHRL